MSWVTVASFHVDGAPVPQGSMSVGRQGQVYHSQGSKLKTWRATVAHRASLALPEAWEPLDSPVRLDVVFAMPATASARKTWRKFGGWQPIAPDLDKLLRGVLDGLTGVLYSDDARVVQITAAKVQSGELGTDEPGATISVWRWSA